MGFASDLMANLLAARPPPITGCESAGHGRHLVYPDNLEEPSVLVFTGVNFTGQMGSFRPPLGANNQIWNDLESVNWDDRIKSMIIPPHMYVKIGWQPYFGEGDPWRWLYCGEYPNMDSLGDGRGWNNDIMSLGVYRTQSWETFRTNCCLQKDGTTAAVCQKYWPDRGDTLCPVAMPNYCAERMNDPECQNWCVNHPGKCDTASRAFCDAAENKDSDFCSCFSNPEDVPNWFLPWCHLSKCRSHGYRTQAHVDDQCNLKVVDCSQQVLLEDFNTADLDNITFEQDCGIESTQPPASGPPTTSPPSTTSPSDSSNANVAPEEDEDSDRRKKMIITGVVGGGVLLIVILLIILLSL